MGGQQCSFDIQGNPAVTFRSPDSFKLPEMRPKSTRIHKEYEL